jgi:L-threonylcarbamoyladenylate synthase
MFIAKKFTPKIAQMMKKGAIGVIPTDTIYGISASALDKEAVQKVAVLRGRAEQGKRFIVLISDMRDLHKFGIDPSPAVRTFLKKYWPGGVSVEFPVKAAKWEYLHMGNRSFAFRVPAVPKLRTFLRRTGPLISTSVNTPGEPPARTIKEAQGYFSDLDFYVDAGKMEGSPSTLVAHEKGKWRVYREGAVKIDPMYSK